MLKNNISDQTPTPTHPGSSHEISDSLLCTLRRRFQEAMQAKGKYSECIEWPSGGFPHPAWPARDICKNDRRGLQGRF